MSLSGLVPYGTYGVGALCPRCVGLCPITHFPSSMLASLSYGNTHSMVCQVLAMIWLCSHVTEAQTDMVGAVRQGYVNRLTSRFKLVTSWHGMAWHDMARMYNCVYMYIDYMKQGIFRSLSPEYTVLRGGGESRSRSGLRYRAHAHEGGRAWRSYYICVDTRARILHVSGGYSVYTYMVVQSWTAVYSHVHCIHILYI